jgi:hypothetical protein
VREEETKMNWKTSGQRIGVTIHFFNRRGNKSADRKNIKRRGKEDVRVDFRDRRRKVSLRLIGRN